MNTSHLKLIPIVVFLVIGLFTNNGCAISLCPPGFVRNLTATEEKDSCVCSSHLEGILKCDNDNNAALLALGYCMTFDFSTNTTIVGKCPYNNNYTNMRQESETVYLPLPDSVLDLEVYMCGAFNRIGKLCTHCHHKYKSSVTSYSLKCIPCEEKYKQIGRVVYISLQVLPVTILYIIIIIFDIRFTKSPWSVFILFSQIIVNMLKYDRKLYTHLQVITDRSELSSFLMKIVLAFYGFWNLNFLPNILPPFCLDIPINGRYELVYEYFVALYPLFLIATIYFFVHLYSRDVKFIVIPWRAIKYCLNLKVCCGCRWIIQRLSSQSIAHSFTSFLVLAYSKILFVSLDLLLPVQLYDLQGNITANSPAVYNGPYMQYFGNIHLPFALCAVFILIMFTVIPTLVLILHPLCAHRCCCKNLLSIRLFVESFQGWFKDGTEPGSHDFRILAGLHPLLQIILALSITLVTVFVQPHSIYSDATWLAPGLIFICCSLFFALARPYKLHYMNRIESLLLAGLGTISFLVSYHIGIYIAIILSIVPMLIVVGYAVYKLFKVCKQKCAAHKCTIRAQSTIVQNENTRLLTEPFTADRVENPSHYCAHSHTTDNDSSVVSEEVTSINIDVTPVYTYGSTD